MKLVFLSFLVFSQIQTEVIDEYVDKIYNSSIECGNQFFGNETEISQVIAKKKQFRFCFLKKLKMMDENGEFVVSEIRKYAKYRAREEKVEEIIKLCLRKKETPLETANEFILCFRANQ